MTLLRVVAFTLIGIFFVRFGEANRVLLTIRGSGMAAEQELAAIKVVIEDKEREMQVMLHILHNNACCHPWASYVVLPMKMAAIFCTLNYMN